MQIIVISIKSLFGDEAPILGETDFQVLLMVSVLPVLGSSLMSPILDSLIGPFGATPANIGLILSAFSAPAIVMTPVAGILSDRYGRKPVLLTALILFGLGGTAIAATTDFRTVLGLRFIQGIGFAGLTPIIVTIIGDLYTREAEATGQGIRLMISGISGAIFPIIAGVLILFAWQLPFLLYALAFLVAAGVYVWFEEPTNDTTDTATSSVTQSTSYLRDLLTLVGHPRMLSFIIARSISSAVWTGFLTYNSLIVIRLMGGTPVEAGLLATIGFLLFAFGGSQAGRATTILDSRRNLLLTANVCLGGGLIAVLFAPDLAVAVIGISVSGFGFGIVASLYRSILTDLSPREMRAGIVSLGESGARFVATVTPFGMGAGIAYLSPSMGFGSALQLIGAGVAVVSSGGGILCLIIASMSPPLSGD